MSPMDAPHDSAPHGKAEIPPAPAVRSISPAPEDYATRPSFLQVLWPVAWLALTFALLVFVQGQGWPAFGGHGDEGHGPASHGTEHHGTD